MLRQKPTQVLPSKLLKEATIHFYCLFDESRFSDICTIMELKELNWLCKHMKNVRSSQPCISMNFFRKAQVLPCEFWLNKIVMFRSSHQRCSITLPPEACNFIKKETMAQVLSCEFCEISKNTFFTEHLQATASVRFKKILTLHSVKV